LSSLVIDVVEEEEEVAGNVEDFFMIGFVVVFVAGHVDDFFITGLLVLFFLIGEGAVGRLWFEYYE
jgi:hypothetical protein